jgi:hypothetical protein
MAYSDATQVSNFLQRSLNAYETAELTNILAAIKIWIDKRLNSTFDLATPTTRYFDGGVPNLDIDPCTAITKVEAINDDGSDAYTYTDTYEYVAEPQNETVKRELRKRLSAFPHGVHRIAVTATFSEYDSGVPADIQIAATRLAAGVINAGKIASLGGNVAAESLEGHSITYNVRGTDFEGIAENDPTVKSILAARQELLVDNYEPNTQPGYDDDDGGLLI